MTTSAAGMVLPSGDVVEEEELPPWDPPASNRLSSPWGPGRRGGWASGQDRAGGDPPDGSVASALPEPSAGGEYAETDVLDFATARPSEACADASKHAGTEGDVAADAMPYIAAGMVLPSRACRAPPLPRRHNLTMKLVGHADGEAVSSEQAERLHTLKRYIGKRNVNALQVNSVGAASAVMQYVEKAKEWQWRGRCEYWTRVSLAWGFNLFLFFVCAIVSLTFGVVKFKGSATSFMLVGWAIAACQTYLIIEPLQVYVERVLGP